MSNTTNTAVAPPDLDAVTKLFDDFFQGLEVLFPNLQHPDTRTRRRVASTARFAEPMLIPTITALAGSARLRAHNTFDAAAGDAALAYRNAIRPLAHRLAAAADLLDYSVDAELAPIARQLLQTYNFAQRLARDPEGAGLRPYVGELAAVVKKTQNHRPKPAVPAGQGFLASRPPDAQDLLEPDGLLPDDEE